MSKYKIVNNDIMEWAANYKGPKFHAIFCDPPYGMSKKKKVDFNAPANIDPDATVADIIDAYHNVQQWGSTGFMNKTWDNDIAFNPETWKALARHLLPGGFGMVFASARGWHRLAVAIEDAGLRIFPSIFGWVYGSGFPKATKINTTNETWAGHRYGLQALKPALEPIICFQKPYEGKPIGCIIETGAGAFNIDGGRIVGVTGDPRKTDGSLGGITFHGQQYDGRPKDWNATQGRWPANFYVQHSPNCKRVGKKSVRGHNPGNTKLVDKRNIYNKYVPETPHIGYADDDGLETVDEWECVDGCPTARLNQQAGFREHPGGVGQQERYKQYKKGTTGVVFGHRASVPQGALYFDAGKDGSASRFFHNSDWTNETLEQLKNTDPAYYCPKSSRKERDAGLNDSPTLTRNRVNPGGLENDPKFAPVKAKNIHPTVKPITLCKWIATLLLPPQEYQPRRILIPFSGSGSEMIGSLLAGWDEIVGVEVTNTPEEPYCDIAESRLKFWQEQSKKGTREPKEILKNNNKLKKSKSKKETSTKAIQLSLLENRNKKE